MQYKIIHGNKESEIEAEMNKLAAMGYELFSFHTTTNGGYSGSDLSVYCHVVMVKNDN